MQQKIQILKAIASEKRLQVLQWLKNPRQHFPRQTDGDLVKDGVCGLLIAQKLDVSQPTASRHMKILVDAGLVRAKNIRQWTFYQRSPSGIAAAKRSVRELL